MQAVGIGQIKKQYVILMKVYEPYYIMTLGVDIHKTFTTYGIWLCPQTRCNPEFTEQWWPLVTTWVSGSWYVRKVILLRSNGEASYNLNCVDVIYYFNLCYNIIVTK